MTINAAHHGRTTPKDVLDTISQFQTGQLRLAGLLDRLWAQIHDLSQERSVDMERLEDLWTDIEIAYAQASAENQTTLAAIQAAEVERAIEGMTEILRRAS
ncbi:hypothetical protein [Sediminicoccus sp. BL-A-41-H5]|uniref:hypothetical protein n=1 Tax=Sediminicoccus sp. BL-A-41-H5 TaxID=3421106 RepID=UPI003D68003F